MKIIALSGKQQSGKDTIRNFLEKKFEENNKVIIKRNFADSLKEIILQLFVPLYWGLTVEDLSLDYNKQQQLPCGKTIREILQWLGTDICRTLYPECWVNAYHHYILGKAFDSSNCIVLTSDVRFPNELEEIQALDGLVIRLTRNPVDDQHESETALDSCKDFNLIVDNSDMSIEEQNLFVWDYLIKEGYLK